MFTHYTGNQQFDLQLNRSLGPILDRPGMDRLTTSVLPRIRSTRQITELAERLAVRFDSSGDAAAAWRLYALAAFYLPEHDPRKRRFIDAMSREFDASHAHLARFPTATGCSRRSAGRRTQRTAPVSPRRLPPSS